MKKKKIISQICIHVILVALTAICLLPFLSMISTSFMKVKGVLPNEPILFPNFPLYLENYVKAWTANHFQTYFFNTLYVSVVGLIVNLLISITMAYSFSRFQFPGKEPIFNLLLLTMMIPAQLAMISQYTVLNGLKLIDTYKGIWLLWGALVWQETPSSIEVFLKQCRKSWKSPCTLMVQPGFRPCYIALFR